MYSRISGGAGGKFGKIIFVTNERSRKAVKGRCGGITRRQRPSAGIIFSDKLKWDLPKGTTALPRSEDNQGRLHLRPAVTYQKNDGIAPPYIEERRRAPDEREKTET